MKHRKTARTILVVAIILILSCTLCNAFAYAPLLDQVDQSINGGDFYPEDYYSINPNTIISAIDQRLPNTFSPMAESPDSFWSAYDSSIQWHQSDFVKTATALNHIAGKDRITDWGFHTVFFTVPCKDYRDGFSHGYFALFRPTWIKGQLYYEAREMVISPSSSIVRWGDGRIYPRPIFGWNKIKLDKFNITADEALRIAEANGGKEIRLNEGNNCQISVIGNDNEWTVLYSMLATYRIDASTGKIVEMNDY